MLCATEKAFDEEDEELFAEIMARSRSAKHKRGHVKVEDLDDDDDDDNADDDVADNGDDDDDDDFGDSNDPAIDPDEYTDLSEMLAQGEAAPQTPAQPTAGGVVVVLCLVARSYHVAHFRFTMFLNLTCVHTSFFVLFYLCVSVSLCLCLCLCVSVSVCASSLFGTLSQTWTRTRTMRTMMTMTMRKRKLDTTK